MFMCWHDITLFSFVQASNEAADESALPCIPFSPFLCRHVVLRGACCFALTQGHQSNKAREQKHVTICHMPLGHKLSSRYTLGWVRPGGSTAAASLRQGPSCPTLSPWDQPRCPLWVVCEDMTCDPPIWRHGCVQRSALPPSPQGRSPVITSWQRSPTGNWMFLLRTSDSFLFTAWLQTFKVIHSLWH